MTITTDGRGCHQVNVSAELSLPLGFLLQPNAVVSGAKAAKVSDVAEILLSLPLSCSQDPQERGYWRQ